MLIKLFILRLYTVWRFFLDISAILFMIMIVKYRMRFIYFLLIACAVFVTVGVVRAAYLDGSEVVLRHFKEGTGTVVNGGMGSTTYDSAMTPIINNDVGPENITQSLYRWRNDNGNETTATWVANEDTAITGINLGSTYRLRFSVSNEGTGESAQSFVLQYGTSSDPTTGTWLTLATPTDCLRQLFCLISSQLVEGDPTTNVADGLTDSGSNFVAGEQREVTATTSIITLDTDDFTELEYSLQVTHNVTRNTPYYFRLVSVVDDMVSPLESYVVTPSLTISNSDQSWPGTNGVVLASPANTEPSGVIWHPRFDKWLWVDDGGRLYTMNYDGSDVRYSVATTCSDYEGVVYADPDSDYIYILCEGNGTANSGRILEADLLLALQTASGSNLTLNRIFELSTPVSGGAGPEGIAFIPDDEDDEGGVFAVSTQADGRIYFYSLSIISGGTTVTHLTGLPWNSPVGPAGHTDVADLFYDREVGELWQLSDAANRIYITNLAGTIRVNYITPGYAEEGISFGIGNRLALADDAGTGVHLYDFPLGRAAAIQLEQLHYRWRNDDGNEAAASFDASEDTATSSVLVDQVKRLRVLVSNAGTLLADQPFVLQYGTAPSIAGVWNTLPAAGSCGTHPICMSSSQLSEGGATTNVASGLTDAGSTNVTYSFVAGEQRETTATTTAITLDPLEFTELEYSLVVTDEADSDTPYYFRIVTTPGSGVITPLDAYHVLPTFTTGNIEVDSTAPTITNITSDKANGTYTIDEVIDIDVTFSEAVTSTGNVTITLETGDTDRTCTFTVSNSTTGTCDYTVQAGDTSADLNVSSVSGTIADQSANAMSDFTPATNLADNKDIVIDTTNPTISTLSPADNATGISTTANLVMTFDAAVTVNTGNVVIKTTVGDTTVETIDITSGQVTGSGTNVITVNPSVTLESLTGYYVQVSAGAVRDAALNSYAGISDTTSWNFTTAALGTPGVTVTPTSVNVGESGATDTYTLVLDSQPTDDVVVTPTSSGGEVTVSPTTVTFTDGNWDTPQIITVTAVDDSDAEGTHSDTITHVTTSGDVDYDGLTVSSVSVTITDNEASQSSSGGGSSGGGSNRASSAATVLGGDVLVATMDAMTLNRFALLLAILRHFQSLRLVLPSAPAVLPPVESEEFTQPFTEPLSVGSEGPQVSALQRLLSSFTPEVYPEKLVTGYYGNLTERAVGRFQTLNNIAFEGESGFGAVGPKTRTLLNSLRFNQI